jgi:hypothetical protein
MSSERTRRWRAANSESCRETAATLQHNRHFDRRLTHPLRGRAQRARTSLFTYPSPTTSKTISDIALKQQTYPLQGRAKRARLLYTHFGTCKPGLCNISCVMEPTASPTQPYTAAARANSIIIALIASATSIRAASAATTATALHTRRSRRTSRTGPRQLGSCPSTPAPSPSPWTAFVQAAVDSETAATACGRDRTV